MNPDFLLTTAVAQKLYHASEDLPLIDFHNHLNVADLASDRSFRGDVSGLWLASDPYKHRAMRICGIPERLITGDASPREKFRAWAQTVPKLLGNPLYHWTELELERGFGISCGLHADNADRLFDEMNEKLASPEYSACGLLKRFHVEYASPCAGAADDLSPFSGLCGIVPSLRADDAAEGRLPWVMKLSERCGKAISSLEEYKRLLRLRLDEFQRRGCRFADHALDDGFRYRRDDGKNAARFSAMLTGGTCSVEDSNAFSSEILRFLGREYARRGWVLQLHIGALRFTSSRLRRIAGGAGGYAGISSRSDISGIVSFLDDLEADRLLPRTILYTLNPADNAALAVLSGAFPGDGEAGKIQLGPAWWFCDHIHGMRNLFETISAYGVLSLFPGMTTDSRSLLSLVRHEYFRRVFCGWLGEKVASGEFPAFWKRLGEIVSGIFYFNIKTVLSEIS